MDSTFQPPAKFNPSIIFLLNNLSLSNARLCPAILPLSHAPLAPISPASRLYRPLNWLSERTATLNCFSLESVFPSAAPISDTTGLTIPSAAFTQSNTN